MSFERSLPIEELTVSKNQVGRIPHVTQPRDVRICLDSSDDDMPIITRRQLRESTKGDSESVALREQSAVCENGCDSAERATCDGSPYRHISSKNARKEHKKPGPLPWVAKSIMKNDMTAKTAVIREIEGYWGPEFIKSHIPKCHRPLVKRGKHGKRVVYRDHESDPRNWLPSVLKAILMIAKLTNNIKWLKDAMNEVVRYRIKHTGNRKPQLVTTDFDVIEDMLVKQWTVEYAFEIRYKHLLVNRKDLEETDTDIDHILQTRSDQDNDDGEYDNDNVENGMDDQDCDNDKDNGDDYIISATGGITDHYLQLRNHTKKYPRHHPFTLPQQQSKHQKPSKSTTDNALPLHQEQVICGCGSPILDNFPLPMDPWSRSLRAYGGRDGFVAYGSGHGGYRGYRASQYTIKQEHQHSQQPFHRFMYPPQEPIISVSTIPDSEQHYYTDNVGINRRVHTSYERNEYPIKGHMDIREPLKIYQAGDRNKIKREFPFDERATSLDEFDGLMSDNGLKGDISDVDIDLQTAELELKLARLRAKKAAMRKSK